MAVSSAAVITCPKCNESHPCQKKGKTAAGDQKYLCTGCKKTFTLSSAEETPAVAKTAATKPATAKTAATKTKVTKSKEVEIKETQIFVNSNCIKTIKSDLSSEDAFSLAVANFKELRDKSPDVSVSNGVKTIKFKITATRKG